MNNKFLKITWAICLLLIFLVSSYLCFKFGEYHTIKMQRALKEIHKSGNPDDNKNHKYHYTPEWIWAKKRDNIGLLSQAKGYNGAAIGFGIIAGSSLVF